MDRWYQSLIDQGFNCKISPCSCYILITGGPLTQWTKDNLQFRSSLWTVEGLPVSLGFKKFFNYNEKENIVQTPEILNTCEMYEKLDGSCLLVSKYQGKLCVRTRGTFDAKSIGNGYEIDYLMKNFPQCFNNYFVNQENVTFVYEWLSPTNKIIIDHGKQPQLVLLNIIRHDNYTYYTQHYCNCIAETLNISRPKHVNIYNNLNELIEHLQIQKNTEGVCCYFNNDQDIKKFKTTWYLQLHYLKSNLNIKSLMEMYINLNFPSKEMFKQYLIKTYDFEFFQICQEIIQQIIEVNWHYQNMVQNIRKFLIFNAHMTKKELAMDIQKLYNKPWQSVAFCMSNGKQVPVNKVLDLFVHLNNTLFDENVK